MKYEAKIVWGWSWFGISYLRCFVDNDHWYTVWLLCLTRRFAIGFHWGGGK